MRNAAAVQPLLTMLEDLHDADSETFDMLGHTTSPQSGTPAGSLADQSHDRVLVEGISELH